MKKIVLLLLLVVFALLMVGCDDYFCGCESCKMADVKCSESCQYQSTGKCTCDGCPDNKTQEVKNSEVKVVTRNYTVKKQQNNMEVKVERPEITGFENMLVQQEVNKEIADAITPYQEEIAELSEGFAYDNSDPMIRAKAYKYYVTYETYALDDYLSIVVKHDIITGNATYSADGTNKTDGLRSNSWKETYVIDTADLTAREKLKIEDVCQIENCRMYMADVVKKMAEEMNVETMIGNEIKEIPKEQKFYIDGRTKQLILYFEPGSIAKYSAGELLFEMPFTYNSVTHKFEK